VRCAASFHQRPAAPYRLSPAAIRGHTRTGWVLDGDRVGDLRLVFVPLRASGRHFMTIASTSYIPSPLLSQPAFTLDGGKTVAVWIGLHVEHWSLAPPVGSFVVKGIHGNWPDHFPDFRTHSFREYGNRIGIFRIFDILRRLELPVSIIVNAEALCRYPEIIEEASRHGADFILQGRFANRMITGVMSAQDEQNEIEEALRLYRDRFGRSAIGWMGPQAGESKHTLQLLAAAGIRFVLDWPSDDGPHFYATDPPVLSVPYQWELDDVDLLWTRNINVRKYDRIMFSAYNGLAQSGSKSARVLGLHVHPWLMGQPARIRHLETALSRLKERPDAQFLTVSELAELARLQLTASNAPLPANLPS
jgi:allantoinase